MKWAISLLLIWVATMSTGIQAQQVEEIRSGDALPIFSVKSNQGKTFSSSSLTGKPLIIVFFHTHCWDCRKELPVVQNLYEQYRNQADFICISRGQPQTEVQTYWEEQRLTLPYSAQEDKTVFQMFARKTIPRIYVCDATGVVHKVFKEKVRKRKLQRAVNDVIENRK